MEAWNVQERCLSLRNYLKYFSLDEMLRCWWHFWVVWYIDKKIVVGHLQIWSPPTFCVQSPVPLPSVHVVQWIVV
jgi:hypothetical protein